MSASSAFVLGAGVLFLLAWLFSAAEPQTAGALSGAYLFLGLANICFSMVK